MTLQSIDHHQIADLCRGSVFLATGGGGDPYVCQLLAEQALKTFGAVELTPLEQVPDDAVVVSLGEVGAPTVSLEQLPVGDEVIRVLEYRPCRKAAALASFPDQRSGLGIDDVDCVAFGVIGTYAHT